MQGFCRFAVPLQIRFKPSGNGVELFRGFRGLNLLGKRLGIAQNLM